MNHRFKTALLWSLGVAVGCLSVGVIVSLFACMVDSGSSYAAGLCVMPAVWGGMAAIPAGLGGFVIGFLKAGRGRRALD